MLDSPKELCIPVMAFPKVHMKGRSWKGATVLYWLFYCICTECSENNDYSLPFLTYLLVQKKKGLSYIVWSYSVKLVANCSLLTVEEWEKHGSISCYFTGFRWSSQDNCRLLTWMNRCCGAVGGISSQTFFGMLLACRMSHWFPDKMSWGFSNERNGFF